MNVGRRGLGLVPLILAQDLVDQVLLQRVGLSAQLANLADIFIAFALDFIQLVGESLGFPQVTLGQFGNAVLFNFEIVEAEPRFEIRLDRLEFVFAALLVREQFGNFFA